MDSELRTANCEPRSVNHAPPRSKPAPFSARIRAPKRLAFGRMTTLTAHFDGQVLIPDEPVKLPMNCALKVRVEPVRQTAPTDRPLQRLVDLAKRFSVADGPPDGAAQHDHYLYGLPKKP